MDSAKRSATASELRDLEFRFRGMAQNMTRIRLKLFEPWADEVSQPKKVDELLTTARAAHAAADDLADELQLAVDVALGEING